MAAIGVTGHLYLTDLDKIERGVNEALRRIETTCPKLPLEVISSLAEGADRLVVRHVLERPEARLVVPLPLARCEYMSDFGSADSRAEFLQLLNRADEVIEMPPVDTREAAYEAAGLYILDTCDVLLAIWDGQSAQGRGGPGAIVKHARCRKLPLAWVHAGNRVPGSQEPTSLGIEQGKVTFERLRSD